MPSAPQYHWSTHSWQPMRFLQHFEKIMGGVMGVPWHIVHLKVSINILFKPTGTLVVRDTSKRLAISPLITFTSLAIRSILSLLLLVRGMKSLSSLDESEETVITFFVSPCLTAYMRLLPHFQNFNPGIKNSNHSYCIYSVHIAAITKRFEILYLALQLQQSNVHVHPLYSNATQYLTLII